MSPSAFRGRPTVTSYVYDGAGRVARVVTASQWTDEDRALMLALRIHQDSLCPGCGHPKNTAWHHQSIDSFEMDGEFVCWACTAAQHPDKDGQRDPVTYPVVVDTRDYEKFPLEGPPQPEILEH